MKSYAEEKNVTLRTPHKNLPPWQPPKKTSSHPGNFWRTRVSLKERSINLSMDLYLSCELSDNLGGVVDWQNPSLDSNRYSYKCFFSLSLLKSMLQKNVRLSRPWSAVRIALHLIRMDFVNFIRRLSIIIIEDCILHPMLPLILWLTATASHDFTPCKQLYQVAACPKRDSLDEIEIPLRDLTLDEINNLPPLEASLVKALFTRICFGGMQGDSIMLKKYMLVWFERFSGNVPVPDASPTWRDYLVSFLTKHRFSQIEAPITLESVGCIMPEDCVLSGFDFHCSDLIDALVAQYTRQNRIDEINSYLQTHYGQQVDVKKKLQSMIWNFRSSINVKDAIFPAHDPATSDLHLEGLWQLVRDDIEAITFQALYKKLS